MKNVIRVALLLILTVATYLIVDFIITKGDKKVATPELRASSSEFGKVTEVQLTEKNYEVNKQTIVSEAYIDNEINKKIEDDINAFIKQADSVTEVNEENKAVYSNVIDTFRVNERVVSIKVTSMMKKVGENDYSKTVSVYNYNTKKESKITLDNIFSDGYKKAIGSDYTDTYLLNHTGIDFYTGTEKTSCSYNKLKEYLRNKLLTSSNLEISETEYTKILTEAQASAKKEAATEDPKNPDNTEGKTEDSTATIEPGTPIGSDEKVIAFSFDDGPHKTNTDKILALLKKYDAHATFFMQGINASYYPEVVQHIADSGNELGNHTWDHKNLKNLSEAEINQEVNDCADQVESITGIRPKVVRPPYGGFNDTVKAVVKEPLIRWSVDSLDWDSRDPDQIVPLVLSEVEDGDIVLFHDVHETTTPAIARLLPELKKRGFRIVSVSELMAAKGLDINSEDLWYSAK